MNDLIETGGAGLPPDLEDLLKTLPPFVTRKQGAKIVSDNLYLLSHRTLESWPLPTRHVNGYAITPTRVLLAMAYAKVADAPVVMGGRRHADQHAE